MASNSTIKSEYVANGQTRPGPSASSAREYVAGAGYAWTATYLRSLPHFIDDVSRDFGDDIYERMLLDSQVMSDVGTLKLQCLAGGLSILPRVDEGDPAYRQAIEISDFCRRCLDRLPEPFETDVLQSMLDALALGNRVAEMTFQIQRGGRDDGKLVLARVSPKPRHSTAFVVDAYMNVIGLLALIPGQGYGSVLVNSFLGDPSNAPNLLPRRKFAILTWRPLCNDPRGTSILRSAYDPWWVKQQTKREYVKYIAQFAGPSLYGVTGENAQRYPQADADGNPILDASGNPIYVEPEQLLLAALQQFRNGTAAAFPFGTEIHGLEMQGEGAPFLGALEWCNKEISKAILHQTLATIEGERQSRAASQVHQDILGLVVDYTKNAVCSMVERQIFSLLIELNFGAEYLDLIPICTLGDTEKQDFAGDASAIAALQTAGYLDPSQYLALDSQLGLPRRSDESIQRLLDAERENAPTDPAKSGRPPDPAAKFKSDYAAKSIQRRLEYERLLSE